MQASAGDAVFAALVAAALSALAIATLYVSWRPGLRVAVRLACAALMTAAGLFAALTLNPASGDLQSRFRASTHTVRAGTCCLRLFTPWVERMAALSWFYAACGAALLALTVVAALVSYRQHGQQARQSRPSGLRRGRGAPTSGSSCLAAAPTLTSEVVALAACPRCVGRSERGAVHGRGRWQA